MVKDFPYYIFKPTFISIVRGDSQNSRSASKYALGRDIDANGSDRRVILFLIDVDSVMIYHLDLSTCY